FVVFWCFLGFAKEVIEEGPDVDGSTWIDRHIAGWIDESIDVRGQACGAFGAVHKFARLLRFSELVVSYCAKGEDAWNVVNRVDTVLGLLYQLYSSAGFGTCAEQTCGCLQVAHRLVGEEFEGALGVFESGFETAE